MSLKTCLWPLYIHIVGTKNIWSYERRVRGAVKQYQQKTGKSINLENPRLFTEKVVWYKLNYDRPDLTNIVDKRLFKSYIAEKLGEGYTVPMYKAWFSVEDIRKDWDKLPNELVLKSTLQSDGKDIKIIHDRKSEDFEQLAKELEQWLVPRNTLINSFCRAYYKATPSILAEQYISQIDGQVYDYKVFCFNGEPYCFYVATDHFPGQLSHISFYDLNWNRLEVRYGEHPNCDVEKPPHFEEMLRISKQLSAGFPFLRVDFFDLGDRVLLSELTLYPGGGVTLIHPESFNRKLGDLFLLPTDQTV